MSGSNNLPGTPMMRVLLAAIEANIPVLLWGKPGIGKTATLTGMADSFGRHLEVIVGSVRDATDYLGLPIEQDGQLVYSVPAWAHRLADAPKGLLFLDELTTCTKAVMAAQLRLVQERWIGDAFQMPQTVSIVAAANPVDQAVNGNELDPPTANRFLHLDWDLDQGMWLNNLATRFRHVTYPSLQQVVAAESDAAYARVGGLVSAYLNANSARISPNVPDTLGVGTDRGGYGPSWAYASPRSWTNLVDVISRLQPGDEAAIQLAARGLVGLADATPFIAWYRGAALYDPQEVVEGRVKVDWRNDSPDRLFALNQSLVAMARNSGSADLARRILDLFTECATQGRKDVVVPPLRTLLSGLPNQVRVPQALRDALGDVVLRGAA